MVSRREWRLAELRGAAAARSLQDRLGLSNSLLAGDQPVDVFAVIQKIGLTCIFQPLTSLLGAYITYKGVKGLIVTTERDLHLQRFTAAHELGHCELGHSTTSLDKDVGFAARGPVPMQSPEERSTKEIEADAFAAELLLPKWLIVAHLKRQSWSLQDLRDAEVVYQLSLRLAVSYAATCWSLASNDLLPKSAAETLVKVPPKRSKQRALPGFKPSTWRGTDIWLLTARDKGALVMGDPHDRLVVSLEEHAAAGYQWDFEPENAHGLVVEKDERIDSAVGNGDVVGAPVTRRLVMTGETDSLLTILERRSWIPKAEPLNTFNLDLELLGREGRGLARIARRSKS